MLSFSEQLFESGSVQNEIGSSCVDCAGLVLDLGTQLTVKRTHAPGSCSDGTGVLESAPHIEQHVVCGEAVGQTCFHINRNNFSVQIAHSLNLFPSM